MKNRIDCKFEELRRKKKKAFIAFLTAGDPNLEATEELVLAFEQAGVDIIELGVPFSDPLADGPTIQAASQRALANGVTLEKIFTTISRIRKKSNIPIVLMMYYNLVFHFGEDLFVSAAKRIGVDGLIIPDLPFEEAKGLIKAAKKNDLATVFFIAPTTTRPRMKKIAEVSTGFIYYVSLRGVTGARSRLPASVVKNVRTIKALTKKPVVVGFGVSTPEQVKTITKTADGVIVASAIIDKMTENEDKRSLVHNVTSFVSRLVNSLS